MNTRLSRVTLRDAQIAKSPGKPAGNSARFPLGTLLLSEFADPNASKKSAAGPQQSI
jgi:hypothetical protein